MIKLVALLLVAAAPVAPAESPASKPTPTQSEQSVDCENRTFASREEAMQSGCCSWHGGVCGCSNGRKKCCDGTKSPSCTC